ncbi:hypothetical protein WA026_001271 [Henosepilachna vigintioctopunctata]|uniref:Gamma-interferon-inducible lysosomal thiol reductase n=1 Tax=Henosepilachna vigintioctopunctata TaxID=420089 RepID=A0AAW1UTB6_9CUCU
MFSMTSINLFLFMSIFVLFIGKSLNISSHVKVSVYYECLCPDSIDFIKNQLWPNYEGLKDNIVVDFVPYGFAKDSSGNWILECQHGTNECRGNKYHACAFDQQKGQNKDVAFLSCSMSSSDPSSVEIIKNCANENGYNWSAISECYNGNRGNDLIAKYGERTDSLKLKFIPSILFNDKFDQKLQDESIDNFLKAACSQISEPKPKACHE